MSIFTPQNQVRLTNVSVVRLKRGGKRFEVACYKNKALEWRRGITKDLDEVLQTHTVFSNVSKGQVAKREDIVQCFGDLFKPLEEEKTARGKAKQRKDKGDAGSDQEADQVHVDMSLVVLEILRKGEVQVSDRERAQQLETTYRDIANVVADKTLDPETRRPYPVTVIEKAMHELGYSVHPNRSAKQQALDVINQLMFPESGKPILRLMRVQMRIRIRIPKKDAKRMREVIADHLGKMEEEEWTTEALEIVSVVDPGHYRILSEIIQSETRGLGAVDVLDLKESMETTEESLV